ncbi:MAG: DoxX family protein [Thioalkalivibrio sp.]
MNNNAIRIVSWILVLIFLLSGGAKLAGLEFEIEAFTRWGYPLWFMYLAGALEVAGGIALMVPRFLALGGLPRSDPVGTGCAERQRVLRFPEGGRADFFAAGFVRGEDFL